MRSAFTTLIVPHVDDTDGESVQVEELVQKRVQVSGTFTSTFDIEVSLDNLEFIKVGASISAPCLVDLPEIARLMRIHTVTWATGDPIVTLGAFMARTDV